jgi:uncharacterized protein YceK
VGNNYEAANELLKCGKQQYRLPVLSRYNFSFGQLETLEKTIVNNRSKTMLRMINATLVYVFLCAAITLTGCASLNDVVRAKEAGTEGMTQIYPVTQEQAWDIARTKVIC